MPGGDLTTYVNSNLPINWVTLVSLPVHPPPTGRLNFKSVGQRCQWNRVPPLSLRDSWRFKWSKYLHFHAQRLPLRMLCS